MEIQIVSRAIHAIGKATVIRAGADQCLALLCVIILASCVTQPTVDVDDSIARIDRYLQSGVDSGFSGAVLIAKDGNIVLNRGFGLANKSEGISNTPDTVFDIGSLTKQFTATAVLTLVDHGDLSLDDSISRFFANLPADKASITVHQLLTHTAGFIDSFGDGDFDHIPQDQFFDILFSTDLLFEPGSKHEYSNAGYSILGRIIELVSGTTYEAYLNEYLFEPAGMQSTGYLLPNWKDSDLAHGYMLNIIDRGTTARRYTEDGRVSWNLKGNGGINATVNDMYLWYQALENHAILSERLTATLMTPYVLEQDNGSSYYAYGWAIYTSERDTKIVSHNGGNGAYFYDFLWLPEDKTVIIFATNAASRQVELAWTLEKMLFDHNYQPKPITKNVYQLVLDFVDQNAEPGLAALEPVLRTQYRDDIGQAHTLNRLGYLVIRSERNPKWAVALFELNTRLFANDGNAWDSLGDAYRKAGQLADAKSAYRKAVLLGESGSQDKIGELDQ